MSKFPRVVDLVWPTMQALQILGGSGSNEEILTTAIEVMNPPEEIQNVPHSDGRQTRLAYRLAWARTVLKKMGAITNSSRAVWSITPSGESMTEEQVLREAPIITKNTSSLDSRTDTELEDIDINAAGDWKQKLLEILRDIPPNAFEKLTQRILRESGFIKVEVTGRTGDGGIDGQGILKMNLISFQIFFQCKRYKGTVGAGDVRDFRGAMQGRGDKGLFVTTGAFSGSAKNEATRDGAPALDLIDGEALCDLLKDLNLGVRTEMVEHVTIDPEVFGVA
ncbi:MAG: Mrr restriction system protein [Magnetococcales bacterium]|nr:Mrr restriction system protein [Magnetococcales bacterium]